MTAMLDFLLERPDLLSSLPIVRLACFCVPDLIRGFTAKPSEPD
jgi:hypothetical protein